MFSTVTSSSSSYLDWSPTMLMAVAGTYLIMNVLVMLMFLVDKHSAKKGTWRISEKKLLIAALFGPFGAWAGMKAFRHKTKKPLFKLVPLFVVLHLVLFILLVY